jgi:hypothetical protein
VGLISIVTHGLLTAFACDLPLRTVSIERRGRGRHLGDSERRALSSSGLDW